MPVFELGELFLFAFLLNTLWEFCHSVLYTTCLEQPWTSNVRLLIRQSVKDAVFILLFYLGTVFAFGAVQWNILTSVWLSSTFVASGLTFAFIDETISTRRGRWEYAPAMPRVLGVGLTPLLELPMTGVLAMMLVFWG